MTALPRTDAAPRRSSAGVTALAVVTALVSTAAVAALYRVFVATAHGQAVDEAALVGAQTRLWWLEDGANAVLGTVSVLGVLAAVAVVAVVALVQRRVRLAVAAATLVSGSLATTQVVKRFLIERPDLDVTYHLENSLPSGHTTFAAAVSAAALLVAPVRLRPLVAVCGAGYTAAVGVATLAAGWHRPSDAVAAALVVLAWGAVAVPLAGGRPGAGDQGRAAAAAGSLARAVLVAGAMTGLAGGGAALAAVWVSVPPGPSGRLGQVVAGVGGGLGVGGAACAVLLALLLLQRAVDRAAEGAAQGAAQGTAGRVVPAGHATPGQGARARGRAEEPPARGTVLAPRGGGSTDGPP